MTLSRSVRREIRDRMAGQAGASARKTALELAETYGISERTVYRESRPIRKTKERATRGKRKIKIEDKLLFEMMSFTYQTDCAAPDTIRIFEENGRIPGGEVKPAWFSRWLQAQKMSRKEMKTDRRPFRRFEAGEPGELMQIDATLAEQFYIDDDGSVAWESSASRNKNRPGNRKSRLVILALMDDYSRCVYAEFTTGQTVNHWLNFEFNAFRQKADPRFRFHGIPRAIYMDNDAVGKNPKFAKAHLALGVKIKKHRPTKKTDRFSSARSKGKIERFLRYLAEKQKITKLQKFSSLEEANRFLFEICLDYNQRLHATTKEAPFERWNRIREEMLIRCEDEELYQILYRDEYQAMVYRDLTLRLNGVWQLPWEEPFFQMIGQKATVFIHPLEQGKLYVQWEGREYTVERRDRELRAFGQGPVREIPTKQQALIREMEKQDFSGLRLHGFDQGPDKSVAYLPVRKGVELDTSGLKPEPAKTRRVDAMMKIARERGYPLSPEENQYLTEVLGKWVTDDEIEQANKELAKVVKLDIKAG